MSLTLTAPGWVRGSVSLVPGASPLDQGAMAGGCSKKTAAPFTSCLASPALLPGDDENEDDSDDNVIVRG